MSEKIVSRKPITVHNHLARKLQYKNYNQFLAVLAQNNIQQLSVQNYDAVSFKVLAETYRAKTFLGFKSIVDFVLLLKSYGFDVRCSYAFDDSINVCIKHYKFSIQD